MELGPCAEHLGIALRLRAGASLGVLDEEVAQGGRRLELLVGAEARDTQRHASWH